MRTVPCSTGAVVRDVGEVEAVDLATRRVEELDGPFAPDAAMLSSRRRGMAAIRLRYGRRS